MASARKFKPTSGDGSADEQVSKRSDRGSDGSDRIVYSEFGNPSALEKAVPDRPPDQQTIKVQATRRGRGGKTVTVLTGFELHPDRLVELAKKLKAQCGTGGTVKDNTIEIQGDHAQKLVKLLMDLGYKAKVSGG